MSAYTDRRRCCGQVAPSITSTERKRQLRPNPRTTPFALRVKRPWFNIGVFRIFRAGLPETGRVTRHRSGQGSAKLTRGVQERGRREERTVLMARPV
jgi:hypothetical protein